MAEALCSNHDEVIMFGPRIIIGADGAAALRAEPMRIVRAVPHVVMDGRPYPYAPDMRGPVPPASFHNAPGSTPHDLRVARKSRRRARMALRKLRGWH